MGSMIKTLSGGTQVTHFPSLHWQHGLRGVYTFIIILNVYTFHFYNDYAREPRPVRLYERFKPPNKTLPRKPKEFHLICNTNGT